MNDAVFEQDGIENVFMAQVARFTPWYIATGTATTLAWLYLVMGEFVLSGLPEWLGWFTVFGVTGGNYWALEQRFLAFTPDSPRRQRGMTLVVVATGSVLLLLLGIFFGLLLPEPIVTLMLFIAIWIVALWRRAKRRRLYAGLPAEPRWRVATRIALVILVTMAALGAMGARV